MNSLLTMNKKDPKDFGFWSVWAFLIFFLKNITTLIKVKYNNYNFLCDR